MNVLFLLNVALPAVVAPADQVPPAPGVTIVSPAITGTGTQGSMLCRKLFKKIGNFCLKITEKQTTSNRKKSSE